MDWANMKHSFVDSLSPQCGTLLATAIAEMLAEGLDNRQINVLSNFIGIIGQDLSYIASQQALNETINISSHSGTYE